MHGGIIGLGNIQSERFCAHTVVSGISGTGSFSAASARTKSERHDTCKSQSNYLFHLGSSFLFHFGQHTYDNACYNVIFLKSMLKTDKNLAAELPCLSYYATAFSTVSNKKQTEKSCGLYLDLWRKVHLNLYNLGKK